MKKLGSCLVVLSLFTAACGKAGSVQVTLTSDKGVTLVGGKGPVTLAPKEQVDALASYATIRKKIKLELKGKELVFNKTGGSLEAGLIESDPNRSGIKTLSGEGAGLSVSSTIKCEPECEKVVKEYDIESCTYYISVPYTVCWWSNHHQECRVEFRREPRYGNRQVERTKVIKNYSIRGSLFTELSNLALIRGHYTTVDTYTKPLSACY